MATKTVNKTQCSDWFRGWGLGNNKLGILTKGKTPNSYIWKGHAQGRHGQILTRTYTVTFDYVGFDIINQQGGNLPDFRDVREAIEILNK